MRISRVDLKTEMLDSYTYEEATINVSGWIRQRSRWCKGHVQTYLVDMRYPTKLLQELGWKKFLLFQLTFGGAIFMPIINPVLMAYSRNQLSNPPCCSAASFFCPSSSYAVSIWQWAPHPTCYCT